MSDGATREPTGGQELREAIRTALLSCPTTGARTCTHTHEIGESADVLIAGPLAALIADAERVRRVWELADEIDAMGRNIAADAHQAQERGEGKYVSFWLGMAQAREESAARIRRALDGDQ